MAKYSNMPVKGGVRKARNRAPTMMSSGDRSLIKYGTLTDSIGTVGSTGTTIISRHYIPGFAPELAGKAGPAICSYYATGKFMPGSTVRWEPSVSFNTTGRAFVGFTDNPEVMALMNTALATYYATPTIANYNALANQVKSLGNVRSFPIWQETEVSFPTSLRRKRFDSNINAITTDVNVLDRSAQCVMYAAFEGLPTTNQVIGGFSFRDVVEVEGISSVIT